MGEPAARSRRSSSIPKTAFASFDYRYAVRGEYSRSSCRSSKWICPALCSIELTVITRGALP